MTSADGGLATRIGSVVAELAYEDIQPAHRSRLTAAVIDAVACAFRGSGTRQHEAALATLDATPAGESTLFRVAERAPAPDAAFANATAAHVHTYDDRHRGSSTHPGSMVVPTALAVGEGVGATGREVLTAVFAGYETIGRLGTLRSGFNEDLPRRPTPVFGPIGCAVTAGSLYGLDGPALGSAIGYGANLAGGLSQVWADGTDEYAAQVGLAARNGVTAAALAREELTAAPRSLEGEYGFYKAFYGEVPDDVGSIAEPLSADCALDDVFAKPVPACGMVVVPIQLAERLRQTGLTPETVDHIDVTVSSRTATIPGCAYAGPFDSATRALMSIPFGIASTLVLDGYSWAACSHHHDDPRIQSVVDHIDLDYDDSYTKYQCEITVTRQDGEELSVDASTPTGVTTADIEAKFDACVGAYRSAAETEALLTELRELATTDDVTGVVSRFGGE